jgi:hypothetical protein
MAMTMIGSKQVVRVSYIIGNFLTMSSMKHEPKDLHSVRKVIS